MRIKDKPEFSSKPKPIAFAPEDTVQSALDEMCERNIGSIIVINTDNTVAGIVTERDMMIRVLGKKLNPEETALKDVMSTDIKVAQENDNVIDWIQTMTHERFRHLPIVDSHGKLINMMSQGDFVAFTWPDLYEKLRHDLTGRLGTTLQVSLITLALITLGLIAFNY